VSACSDKADRAAYDDAVNHRQPAGQYHLHTVQIFTVTTGGISRNSVFHGSQAILSAEISQLQNAEIAAVLRRALAE